MCYRKGQRGVATNLFNSIINLGGPLEPTRAKKQAGYSTSSGVIKLLSLCQLKLSTYQRDVSTFFIYNDLVGVVPSVLSNDGNALKPAIELDLYKKQSIRLNVKVDYEFVSKNPEPSLEYLKDHIVPEVVVTSVTTLDNTVSLPCVTEYVQKKGNSGENLEKSFIETIKIIQSCERCQQKAKVENNILNLKSGDCNNRCEACLITKEVCDGCNLIGHQHINQCLRACFSCINENKRCITRVVLVLTVDYEQGNKTAFLNIISSIKNNTIDPDLALLAVLPDAVHAGKSLKASFCNWQLIIGNRSSKAVMEKMSAFIPKSYQR